MAKIVTLTTDWNNSDYYIGAVKASIISACPDAVFVDISHNIEHFNWQQAAFVLGSVVDDFPAGTIHIIGVNSEPTGDMKVIVAKYKKQFFICTDNGTLGIIFKDEPELAVAIDVGSGNEDCVFIEKNVFAEIAKIILRGKDFRELGEEMPGQGTQVQSLVWEDPKPMRRNYFTPVLHKRSHHREKPGHRSTEQPLLL